MVLTVLTRFFFFLIIPDIFICPLQKKIIYFFSKFKLLMYGSNADTPYGPLSVFANAVRLHHFS